jgi:hypothetical protein
VAFTPCIAAEGTPILGQDAAGARVETDPATALILPTALFARSRWRRRDAGHRGTICRHVTALPLSVGRQPSAADQISFLG